MAVNCFEKAGIIHGGSTQKKDFGLQFRDIQK